MCFLLDKCAVGGIPQLVPGLVTAGWLRQGVACSPGELLAPLSSSSVAAAAADAKSAARAVPAALVEPSVLLVVNFSAFLLASLSLRSVIFLLPPEAPIILLALAVGRSLFAASLFCAKVFLFPVEPVPFITALLHSSWLFRSRFR